jgi:aromatic ring-opening dioxygenase catalytic subunit (LigB family)
MTSLLPVLFLGHGGGPLPLLGHEGHYDLLRTWKEDELIYQTLHDEAVKAIVIVSAHYESIDGSVSIMTDENPELLFDYGGFPPETYQYTMPNPGNPALGRRISTLLTAAKITNKFEKDRGHDHGVFVPLMALGIAAKRPTLPVISISLRGPCDYRNPSALNEAHYRCGAALAPLRKEGCLIIGSGNSFHSMQRVASKQTIEFDKHLALLAIAGAARGAAGIEGGEREEDLRDWLSAPYARTCHPRPEHIIPLLVCAGAGGGTITSSSDSGSSNGSRSGSGSVPVIPHDFMGNRASHFVFH